MFSLVGSHFVELVIVGVSLFCVTLLAVSVIENLQRRSDNDQDRVSASRERV